MLELVHAVFVGGIVLPAAARWAMAAGFEIGRIVHGGESADLE